MLEHPVYTPRDKPLHTVRESHAKRLLEQELGESSMQGIKKCNSQPSVKITNHRSKLPTNLTYIAWISNIPKYPPLILNYMMLQLLFFRHTKYT